MDRDIGFPSEKARRINSLGLESRHLPSGRNLGDGENMQTQGDYPVLD